MAVSQKPKLIHSENKPRGFFFAKALFEGLIFGAAYLRKEICVSKSIWPALELEGNLPFLLCFTLYLKASTSPGAYIWRGDLTEGFLRYEFWGLIFGGAYFRNFTVSVDTGRLPLTTEKQLGYCIALRGSCLTHIWADMVGCEHVPQPSRRNGVSHGFCNH